MSFNEQKLLGGEGVVVEFDECKIGQRKYNRGIDQWKVFGYIRFDRNKYRNPYRKVREARW